MQAERKHIQWNRRRRLITTGSPYQDISTPSQNASQVKKDVEASSTASQGHSESSRATCETCAALSEKRELIKSLKADVSV